MKSSGMDRFSPVCTGNGHIFRSKDKTPPKPASLRQRKIMRLLWVYCFVKKINRYLPVDCGIFHQNIDKLYCPCRPGMLRTSPFIHETLCAARHFGRGRRELPAKGRFLPQRQRARPCPQDESKIFNKGTKTAARHAERIQMKLPCLPSSLPKRRNCL